jgi:CBS domain-containing protein
VHPETAALGSRDHDVRERHRLGDRHRRGQAGRDADLPRGAAILAKRQTERRVGPTPPIAEILVLEAMDRNPPTADPDMDVDELRRMMVDSHTRYVPVMEGETIVGIVSFHDVAKAVLEERNLENKLLKAYIKDWPAP